MTHDVASTLSGVAIVVLVLAEVYRCNSFDHTDYLFLGSVLVSQFLYRLVDQGSALWLIPQALLSAVAATYIVRERRRTRSRRGRRHGGSSPTSGESLDAGGRQTTRVRLAPAESRVFYVWLTGAVLLLVGGAVVSAAAGSAWFSVVATGLAVSGWALVARWISRSHALDPWSMFILRPRPRREPS